MYPVDRSSVCVSPEHLLKKPKILILDDSTSAVDTATDAQIREAFAEEIPGYDETDHCTANLQCAGGRPDHRHE